MKNLAIMSDLIMIIDSGLLFLATCTLKIMLRIDDWSIYKIANNKQIAFYS